MEYALKLFDDYTEDKSYTYVNGNIMKVNKSNILDQYFTKEDVAIKLFDKTKTIISKYENDIYDFIWLEPSAGNGTFYNLFPLNSRIGIDIHPLLPNLIEEDYLKYKLPKNKRIIVMEKEQKYYDIILKRVGDFNKNFEPQTLFGNEM